MTNEEQSKLAKKEACRLWKSRSFKISMLIAAIILIIGVVHCIRIESYKIICNLNLCYGVHQGFQIYANDYNDKMPPLDAWNDMLIEYADVVEKAFHCPGSKSAGQISDYAVNKNLAVSAWTIPSGDTVLAFESVPGWNQFGASEIFNFNNHKNSGRYNTLSYPDGYYLKPEEVNKIKWKLEK